MVRDGDGDGTVRYGDGDSDSDSDSGGAKVTSGHGSVRSVLFDYSVGP